MYTYSEFFKVLEECVLSHPDGRIRIDKNYVTVNYADYDLKTLYAFYKSGHTVHGIARGLMERKLREIEETSVMGANVVLVPFCDRKIPKIKSDNLMLAARIGNRMCTFADMLQKGYADEKEFLMEMAIKTLKQTETVLLCAIPEEVYFLTTRDPAAGALPILFPNILENATKQTGAQYLLPVSDKGTLLIGEKSFRDKKMQEILQEMGEYAGILYKINGGRLEKIMDIGEA